MIEVLPSILSADFARLGEEIAKVERAGASFLHVDVMDGHFVPNISIGIPVVDPSAKLPASTRRSLDDFGPRQIRARVHPRRRRLCAGPPGGLHASGSNAPPYPFRGGSPGVVLNPATPIAMLSEVLDLVDHVLIMSVNPGFGGQAFIPNALKKIQALAWRRKELGLNFAIEIDGGVSTRNAGEITRAGCDWLVAGCRFFTPRSGQAFIDLQRAAREAVLQKV